MGRYIFYSVIAIFLAYLHCDYLDAYTYNLAICAIFKNEASYLKEWIEFHRLVGVEHFYLYNNLSTDDYLSVLQPYINNGLVEVIDWPFTKPANGCFAVHVQSRAYKDAITRASGVARWVAFLDLDEFLFATQENNLVQFLNEYEEFGGVCVNWQLYGTPSEVIIDQSKLVTETLTFKAPTEYGLNKSVKSIVQPERVAGCNNAHFFYYKKGFFQVTPSKNKFYGAYSPSIEIEKIRINHYWIRDLAYFKANKLDRLIARLPQQEIENRFNIYTVVEDDSILKFVNPLRSRIFLCS